jgi:hypothetical protein
MTRRINLMENESTVITEEQKQLINDTVENAPKSDETKLAEEIFGDKEDQIDDCGDEDSDDEATDEVGDCNEELDDEDDSELESKELKTVVDPVTGEHTVVGDAEEINPKTLEEKFDDIANAKINEDDGIIRNLSTDDIKAVAADENGSMLGKYDISDDTAIELISLINQYQDHKITKITFAVMPKQIQDFVNDYMNKNGVGGFSVRSNTIRNTLSETLIDEMISNIKLNRSMNDFNAEIEHMYDETNKEISPLIKDYNTERREELQKAYDKVEDEEKKQKIGAVIDAIHQAYSLEEFIKQAPYIKIKGFYLEKPKKIFMEFMFKYKEGNYHIYELGMITNILHRHLQKNKLITEDDTASAIKFLLAYCLYCKNYKPAVPEQHAFMYYVTYNIVLLDIYKDEQYNEFAPEFLSNVMSVINNLKK